MIDLASLFVGGGVCSVIVALIGVVAHRKLNSANYADILARMAREIADDLRADNQRLEDRVTRLERRIGELTETLRQAIQRLDEYGHDTDPLRAVLHGRINGTGGH